MKYRVVKDTSRSQIDTIYNIPLHFKKQNKNTKHKTVINMMDLFYFSKKKDQYE